MKFYNPFKPHIVQDGFGEYFVRKLSFWMLLPCWKYMTSHGYFYNYWAGLGGYGFSSAEAAEMTMRACRSRKDEIKRHEKKRNIITFVKMIPGRNEA